MYINLRFTEEQCNELLSKIGYNTEVVTLYYSKDLDPYGKQTELIGYEWKVCYEGKKPKELCVEKPLLEDCRKYLYDNVVQKVISDWIFNMMLVHTPFCSYRD
jgi:hypothetical protein